jgi:hypothetical protein
MPHVKENLGDTTSTIKFHSCPKKSWYKKWADLLHRKGMSKFTPSTVICSNHFEYGQPRPKSPHPSRYLKGYGINHEVHRKERRKVVYVSRNESEKVHEACNEGLNENKSTESLESPPSSAQEDDCCDIDADMPSSETPPTRTKEEYESEIRELKEELQIKEKEYR